MGLHLQAQYRDRDLSGHRLHEAVDRLVPEPPGSVLSEIPHSIHGDESGRIYPGGGVTRRAPPTFNPDGVATILQQPNRTITHNMATRFGLFSTIPPAPGR